MFTLLHLLIYSPLICVALSQRKQFKANEPHPQRPLVYGVSINLILIWSQQSLLRKPFQVPDPATKAMKRYFCEFFNAVITLSFNNIFSSFLKTLTPLPTTSQILIIYKHRIPLILVHSSGLFLSLAQIPPSMDQTGHKPGRNLIAHISAWGIV